jgi:Protein of unknown function (DUF2510)
VRLRAWPWSVAVALPTAGVLALYLAIVDRQGNRPARWFVALLAVAGALPVAGLAAGAARRACFAGAAVVLGGLAIIAAMSIGGLLVPPAVVAWVAFATDPGSARRRHEPIPAGWYRDPADVHQRRYWDGTAWTGTTASGAPSAAGGSTEADPR